MGWADGRSSPHPPDGRPVVLVAAGMTAVRVTTAGRVIGATVAPKARARLASAAIARRPADPRPIARVGRAAIAVGLTLIVAGCGIGAAGAPASLPAESVGAAATAGAAAAQTRGVVAAALGSVAVQFGDATRPYRPAESGRLRDAPRAVYQVVLPDQPDAGFIVVYEFPDAGAAVDAGNEEAGYLGTGNGRVQFPPGTQHVIRALGPTLILYSWLPAASADPTAGKVADALGSIGIGFTVPN